MCNRVYFDIKEGIFHKYKIGVTECKLPGLWIVKVLCTDKILAKMRKTDFLDKWINGYKLIETKDGKIYKLTEYKLEWHGVLKFCGTDGIWKKTSLSNIKDLKR